MPDLWRVVAVYRGSGRRRRQWFKLRCGRGDAVGPGGGIRWFPDRKAAKAARDDALMPRGSLCDDLFEPCEDRE